MKPDARWLQGQDLAETGQTAEAEALLREEAAAGRIEAMRCLGDLLTDAGKGRRREGLAWYRRAADLGDAIAAWNSAMTWRMSGDRRRYRHWIGRAAALGYDEAGIVLAEIGRRQAADRRWPMFKTTLIDIDPEDIADMLQALLDGDVTAADVRDWADGVACGELLATPELRERRRLTPILEELARGNIRPARARELLFAMNPD